MNARSPYPPAPPPSARPFVTQEKLADSLWNYLAMLADDQISVDLSVSHAHLNRELTMLLPPRGWDGPAAAFRNWIGDFVSSLADVDQKNRIHLIIKMALPKIRLSPPAGLPALYAVFDAEEGVVRRSSNAFAMDCAKGITVFSHPFIDPPKEGRDVGNDPDLSVFSPSGQEKLRASEQRDAKQSSQEKLRPPPIHTMPLAHAKMIFLRQPKRGAPHKRPTGLNPLKIGQVA